MHYRTLGSSGMKVSSVSLGGWINFGDSKMADENAKSIIHRAVELGVNFFDIADIYERGKAETQMGAILKDFPRHTLVVSTKVFWAMSDDVNDRGLSRKHIMESIDKSLKRLGMDYVDIYFCHRHDPETSVYETARAMNDIITQGKVLYWGTSEWKGEQIQEAYDICLRYGWHLPQTEQPQYSLVYREPVEDNVMPVTEKIGVGLVPWSPLGQGLLTGKYDEGIPEDTRFAKEQWLRDRYINDKNVQRVRDMKKIADDLGVSRAQLALAWCLSHPNVSSVITGATKISQLEDNVKASEMNLSADVVAQLDTLFAKG